LGRDGEVSFFFFFFLSCLGWVPMSVRSLIDRFSSFPLLIYVALEAPLGNVNKTFFGKKTVYRWLGSVRFVILSLLP
jgi:hypothetical protein